MNDAKLLTEPQERADAWAAIDKKITELAPAVDWVWDKNPLIHSTNVNASRRARSTASGTWPYTSLK